MDKKKKTKHGIRFMFAFMMLAVCIFPVLDGCSGGRDEQTAEETAEDKVQEDTGKGYVRWVWGKRQKGKKIEEGSSTKDHTFPGAIWMYYEDGEIPFVDEETFELIRKAYEEVDYSAGVEKGNPEVYEEYKQKFRLLVQNEVPFLDRATGRKIYVEDWKDPGGYSIMSHVTYYYFFDMNGDSLPELCLHGYYGRTAVFTYDAGTDQIVLWTLTKEYQEIAGTLAGACYTEYGSEICEFFGLNPHGGIRLEILFWAEHADLYHYDINMVMFPDYDAREKRWEITEEMKQQGIFEESSGQWFFRVTDEQFEELEKPFVEAIGLAREKMLEEEYTYDELFGE